MTDHKPHANPLFLMEEEIRLGMDLLLGAADALDRIGEGLRADREIGRTQRRLLALIGARPGITLAELVPATRMPKQSLSRQINGLVARDLVAARDHPSDGRRKALRLTAQGKHLDDALWELERQRIARAYRRAGAEAVEGFKMVMRDLTGRAGSPGRRPVADRPADRT